MTMRALIQWASVDVSGLGEERARRQNEGNYCWSLEWIVRWKHRSFLMIGCLQPLHALYRWLIFLLATITREQRMKQREENRWENDHARLLSIAEEEHPLILLARNSPTICCERGKSLRKEQVCVWPIYCVVLTIRKRETIFIQCFGRKRESSIIISFIWQK